MYLDTSVYTLKVSFFNTGQKLINNLGYFCYVICGLELSKFAQSGHTAHQTSNVFPGIIVPKSAWRQSKKEKNSQKQLKGGANFGYEKKISLTNFRIPYFVFIQSMILFIINSSFLTLLFMNHNQVVKTLIFI